VNFFNKGVDNPKFGEFITDFRIQKIEKVSHRNEDGDIYVPFFITIKQTQINKDDAKLNELRKRLSETISF
jgi:hypothetical protein